jgi:hypothetical protein
MVLLQLGLAAVAVVCGFQERRVLAAQAEEEMLVRLDREVLLERQTLAAVVAAVQQIRQAMSMEAQAAPAS